MTATVKAAITSIGEETWQTIEYPNAIYDDAEGRWVSDAEVAKVAFTANRPLRRRHMQSGSSRLIVDPGQCPA